jgi:hypothetical protein
MKRQYLNVLFTVICVLGLGLGGGQVLPAGTYRVSRVDSAGLRELIVRSSDTGAGVFVI